MPNPDAPAPYPPPAPVGAARPPWVLPLAIVVVTVLAVSLLLARCGAQDATQLANRAPAATPAAADSSPTIVAGAVIAAGVNVLGADNVTNLRANDAATATGHRVRVQSVPADEGFWIGPGPLDRLWVQLTGTRGESVFTVRRGDTVDFTGVIARVTPNFTADSGVTRAEGADQIAQQGFYLSVPVTSVKLSS
ncbi:hypothetical protein [Actinoplanes sp. NPDC051859]|uniref:hypothetical protein n=1 Tax=Actinoplanes sp. NPDC051859 TaxID=3363909 RepID=UPI0037A4857D